MHTAHGTVLNERQHTVLKNVKDEFMNNYKATTK